MVPSRVWQLSECQLRLSSFAYLEMRSGASAQLTDRVDCNVTLLKMICISIRRAFLTDLRALGLPVWLFRADRFSVGVKTIMVNVEFHPIAASRVRKHCLATHDAQFSQMKSGRLAGSLGCRLVALKRAPFVPMVLCGVGGIIGAVLLQHLSKYCAECDGPTNWISYSSGGF